MLQAVIIAGGKGTRLGMNDIPKPMVEIDGKPLLQHQIELAKRFGINEFFIMSGYLSEVIINYFGTGEKFGVKIHHVVEPYPLGTAGCLKLLQGKLKDRFIVFYGDVVMDFDINEFINYDNKYKELGTAIVHPNDHPYDSDLLEINEKNCIINIMPKPHNDGNYYSNLVNAALYIFSPKIFDYIDKDVMQDIGKDILPKILKSDDKIIAYKTAEYIKDMGTLDRFEKVKQDYFSGKIARLNKINKRACIFLDRDGVINKNMDSNPSVAGFELLPDVKEAIKLINNSEYLSVIVTNQPMIAKGFVSFSEINDIHKKMETLLGEYGAYLNGIYFCPHHPESGFAGEIKTLKIDCDCRKPKIGMLKEAQVEMNIDFSKSWMIGDSERDIVAGKNAGCKTVSIGNSNLCADYNAQNLLEAVEYIMQDNSNS
ncbi:MAG: HAD-IIIA family hydrolase [bacterium]|nr:HAD-IIIA family hydrolase [bacterium]